MSTAVLPDALAEIDLEQEPRCELGASINCPHVAAWLTFSHCGRHALLCCDGCRAIILADKHVFVCGVCKVTGQAFDLVGWARL